jgi:hypothetical protein
MGECYDNEETECLVLIIQRIYLCILDLLVGQQVS